MLCLKIELVIFAEKVSGQEATTCQERSSINASMDGRSEAYMWEQNVKGNRFICLCRDLLEKRSAVFFSSRFPLNEKTSIANIGTFSWACVIKANGQFSPLSIQ